jgi:ABC-type transport system substrate-binding protein
LQSWAERRTARLLGRSLYEFIAPGANGGKYLCPVAEVAVAKPPLRITLTVKPELQAGAAGPTAYDIARAIAAAESGRLGAATAGLRATDRDRLLLDLRQPVARPDALLAAVSLAHGPAAASAAAYRAAETAGREAVFLANPGYFAAAATQPKELIELRCDDDAAALRALRIGLADVADRLPPGEAARLRSDPRFVVQPYNVPLVHCLVPNLRRPLPADRAFRRALVYGMHRQAILAELDGSKLPGCRMLSGPFPLGLAGDDPLRYAADPQIEPRPYDPEMAAALALGAWRQFAAAEKARGRKASELSLVLMHPARPLPRAACAEIQGQWKLLGIAVELRETPALPARIPDDVDLLYVEAFVSEPLLDAAALLGPDGPAGGCSPAMALALRRLEQAADFAAAQARLREIHRLAFEETAVLPLWQWPEFFARRADLQGTGDSIATLYQNIEQWQPGFAWPAE